MAGLLLVPFYAVARAVPQTRDGAIRLGLVTIDQMIAALVHAIEDPPPAGTARIVRRAGDSDVTPVGT